MVRVVVEVVGPVEGVKGADPPLQTREDIIAMLCRGHVFQNGTSQGYGIDDRALVEHGALGGDIERGRVTRERPAQVGLQ